MRKYKLNENFFSQWSEEMAYMLGFIAADGCLYKYKHGKNTFCVQIGLSSVDEHILLSFNKILETDRPLKNKKSQLTKEGYIRKNQSILQINSVQIAQDLINLGIHPRKSWTMEFPTNYPKEFMNHYLRGFFDGDGSVYFIKHPSQKNQYLGVNFTGSEQYLLGLKAYLQTILGKDCGYMRALKSKGGTYYQLVYSGGLTIKKMLDYFYLDSTEETRLKRKYDIFFNFYKDIDLCLLKQINNQKFNTKSSVKFIIEAFGESKSLTDWAKDPRCIVNRQTLYYRIIKIGMEPEKALTTSHDNLQATNHSENKSSNNQKYTSSEINHARHLYQNNHTVKEISEKTNISESALYDAISGRTFKDPSFIPAQKTTHPILITYSGKTQSIKEWSIEYNLPYSTIDRRYRDFQVGRLTIDQVFHNEVKRLNLGKAQSEKDKKAYELAYNLRNDYKNGLIGKKLYEKYNIPKSRAMDLIANRTCKEEEIWWKNN